MEEEDVVVKMAEEDNPESVTMMEAGAAHIMPPCPSHYISPHLQQISVEEFESQVVHYTEDALRALRETAEYKKYSMKCCSCGSSWYHGQCLPECSECEGYAMHRPCLICHGHCGAMWQRDVQKSHQKSAGFWVGECGHKLIARRLKDGMLVEQMTMAMETLQTKEHQH